MNYSAIANLPSLGPGSTGGDVATLQKWLVQNGFLTQAEMDSGPGIYGPKTANAVAKWQQQMGFDTQGNPGWFGPLSKQYIAQQTTQSKPAATSTASTPQSTQGNIQKAVISAVADVSSQASALGNPPMTFADALARVKQDPNLIQRYADNFKLDSQSFNQQLQSLSDSLYNQTNSAKTQFENERKKLAEQFAAAGTAYSGFRTKAQEQLGQQESGIVTSLRSQYQQQLNNLSSQFASKYGSEATPPATINYQNPLEINTSLSGQVTQSDQTPAFLSSQTPNDISGSVYTNAAQSLQSNQGLTQAQPK